MAPDWFLFISVVYQPITLLHFLRHLRILTFALNVLVFALCSLSANQIQEMFPCIILRLIRGFL